MNKVIVIGYLGQAPEMRYTPAGVAVTSFSVASYYSYTRSDGQRKTDKEWFQVSAFGKLAGQCHQHLIKGQQVYVEGRLQSRSYTTQGGEFRYSLDIMAGAVHFLGKPEGRESTVDAGQETC